MDIAKWLRTENDVLLSLGHDYSDILLGAANTIDVLSVRADITDELAEALQSLYDEQNGPPLIRYAEQWQMAADKASKALAKYNASKNTVGRE